MNEQLGGSEDLLAQYARRIDLAHHRDFAIGPVRVQPALRRIAGPEGEQMLEPKVMQVLIALADPIGSLLSRDDLIERCWDGRVIGDTSINRVISLLRGALRQVAHEAVTVDNVPKVGYRLVVREPAPGEAAAPAEGDHGDTAPAAPASAPGRSRRGLVAGAATLVALALVAAFLWLRPLDRPTLPELRVAMLPLEVAEGVDPLYAAGLESELRAALARVGALQVTASESARLMLEEDISPVEIGQRLGVDYVWLGDFAVEAEQASLGIELIAVDTGERSHSDRLMSAPQAAQHLPFRTARSISLALGRPVGEQALPRSVSADDYRLMLTAIGLIRTRGQDERRAAFDILEGVTDRNPRFAAGLGALAKAHFLYPAESPEKAKTYLARALELAQRAIEIDPEALEALKIVGLTAKTPETAFANLGLAVELDPGDSEALFWLGVVQKRYLEDGGKPLSSARKMVEIDPLWPASWTASQLAAESGDLALAREMERDILAACVTPSQALLARGRLAMIDGDLSGFLRLTRQAERMATDAERRWGRRAQERMARLMLDLPLPEGAMAPRFGGIPIEILRRVDREDLPSPGELARVGLTGKAVWEAQFFITAAAPLYLQHGRHAELVEAYDARFASPAEFARFAAETGDAHTVLAGVGSPLVMALRRAGRAREAEAHLEALEALHARLARAAPQWLDTVLLELGIAALRGENERAARQVARLPEFGWPHAIVRSDPTFLNLLRGDPLYDDVRDLPEARAVLDPIRRDLARERREVLALGL